MRLLIKGGAGFIGSHLCEAYLTRGDEVHVLDDLSTGSIGNIRQLRADPNFGDTVAAGLPWGLSPAPRGAMGVGPTYPITPAIPDQNNSRFQKS
jgi:hypothetical protein